MSELVLEKRSYPRVDLAAGGVLVYREEGYSARVENISLGGALLSLDEDYPPIAPGERCALEVPRGACEKPLRFTTRLVHLGFGMACVRFVDLDQGARLMLRSIIAHRMPQPRQPRAEGSLCRS